MSSLHLRFAIASDLHIALPQTIRRLPQRLHLVEFSISAFEAALAHLAMLDLDFLLLPGDLTQDGEPDNHRWLQERLQLLPFPVYVVPGNHDVLSPVPTECSIGASEFPDYYRNCGYRDAKCLYYTQLLAPGLRLVALNSNQFTADGRQLGRIDAEQLSWLQDVLAASGQEQVLAMVHHNVLEHLPGQAKHPLGRRYMVDNAAELLEILHTAGVQLIFTGHLHVQDIAHNRQLYEITTGSLVSYPHPYRVLELESDRGGELKLTIQSFRVEQIPECANLTEFSREWLGDHSYPFMHKLVQCADLELSETETEAIARDLRYFWADISRVMPFLISSISHYLSGNIFLPSVRLTLLESRCA
ncbi:MAG: metallophosphoesterase [Spirulinaceae cyanobacterium RM2_2_10]|nr:metallophosphoesterase [Spirulinaceae cyanobacterium RM2_2_10]